MNGLKDMTCKDCKKRNWCMEWSRLYPCASFEKKEGIDDANVRKHKNADVRREG